MATHYLEQALLDALPAMWPWIQRGSLDGLWVWDLDAREHEWMDRRFWEVLGYDPDVMPHSPSAWLELIHPDDGQAALACFEAHLQDPEANPYLQTVRYKAGPHRTTTTGWVFVICRGHLVEVDGRPRYMVGIHTDVTTYMSEMAALEERLTTLEARRG